MYVDLGLHVLFNFRPRGESRRVFGIKLSLDDGASAAFWSFLLFAFHESGRESTVCKANQHVADDGAGGVVGNEPEKFLWGLWLSEISFGLRRESKRVQASNGRLDSRLLIEQALAKIALFFMKE